MRKLTYPNNVHKRCRAVVHDRPYAGCDQLAGAHIPPTCGVNRPKNVQPLYLTALRGSAVVDRTQEMAYEQQEQTLPDILCACDNAPHERRHLLRTLPAITPDVCVKGVACPPKVATQPPVTRPSKQLFDALTYGRHGRWCWRWKLVRKHWTMSVMLTPV